MLIYIKKSKEGEKMKENYFENPQKQKKKYFSIFQLSTISVNETSNSFLKVIKI